jgi:hypothetical protein
MNPPPIYIEDPDRPGHNLYEEVRAIAVCLRQPNDSSTVHIDRLQVLAAVDGNYSFAALSASTAMCCAGDASAQGGAEPDSAAERSAAR